MTHGDYIARWFEDRDLEAYVTGMRKNLFYSYDERRFRWKFRENPSRLGFVSVVVVEDTNTGRPVGFNGFLPLKLRIRDERFLAAQGVDGFIEPSHRGHGLFTLTIEFMAQQLSEAGPELLIGFNVPQATTAAVRAGSVKVGGMHRWTLERKPRDRAGEATRVKVVQGNITEINRVYEEWAKTVDCIHTSRDPAYLDWRVARDPMSSHECYLIRTRGENRGYIIVSKTERNGQVELTLDDYVVLGNDYRILAEAVDELSASQRPNTIEIRTLPNAPFESALADLGFLKESEPLYSLILKDLSKPIARDGRLIRDEIDLAQLSSWYLTYLDVL